MNCNKLEFYGLSNEILKRGNRLRFQASGKSMSPFIRDGDIIEVEPVGGRQIRQGEVIFCKDINGQMFAHRVIREYFQENKHVFVTKGDANTGDDAQVCLEQVLGTVETVERAGKKIYINKGWHRLLGLLYVRFFPFLITAKQVGSWMLPFIQGLKIYGYFAKKLVNKQSFQWVFSEDSAGLILCKKEETVIGRITIDNFLKDESIYHGWWIFSTWVSWRYRRLGIGRRLTEMACDCALSQGASEIKLLVFKDNRAALKLYQKLGFFRVSIPEIDQTLEQEAKQTLRQRIIMQKNRCLRCNRSANRGEMPNFSDSRC